MKTKTFIAAFLLAMFAMTLPSQAIAPKKGKSAPPPVAPTPTIVYSGI
jgi:hypothetical protein